jgi:hypothetical protein
VPRRISIALLLLALFWMGEPAYALWNFAAEHACCLPKAAAQPSCHEMAHHGAGGETVASGHSHSDCAHDCCTKLRTANSSALAAKSHSVVHADPAPIVVASISENRMSATRSTSSERGPPTIA